MATRTAYREERSECTRRCGEDNCKKLLKFWDKIEVCQCHCLQTTAAHIRLGSRPRLSDLGRLTRLNKFHCVAQEMRKALRQIGLIS